MKRTPLKRKSPLAVDRTLTRKPMQRKQKPSRRNKKETTYTKSLREEVFERDGGVCQLCGRFGEQIHHTVPRGRFYYQWYTFTDVNNPINLMLVCHKCHDAIHNVPGMVEQVIEIQEERFGPLRQAVHA